MSNHDSTAEEPTNETGWRARLPRIFGAGQDENSSDNSNNADDANLPLPAEEENPQEVHEHLSELRAEMLRMSQLVESINRRESSQEKVFNTLHSELQDYKNDFIYEHLKPVVRQLLFLYDSFEQFDREVARAKTPASEESGVLTPSIVRDNVQYFKDELTEALRLCEVTPIPQPRGRFNPKLQRVVKIVPVEAEQHGIIQRVLRSGWYLNQQVLRPAEVVVGKHTPK